jgi:GGDEF domain-containing protein
MAVQGVVSRSRSFQHSRKAEQTRLIGEHEVSCSISIRSAQDHMGYEDPDEVLRNADTAMYHGKASGKIDRKARAIVYAALYADTWRRRGTEIGSCGRTRGSIASPLTRTPNEYHL